MVETSSPDEKPHNEEPRGDGLPNVTPDFVEQDHPEYIDDVVPTRGYQEIPMIGLGGSAGSIPALERFFRALPADSGLTFVVVMHLSPAHESNLADLISRWTPMPVLQAVEGQKVEANTVYVIPPGKHLTTVNNHLQLTDLDGERGRRVAVDLFFRSLADTHGPHAAGIVLSGADGDGASGLKRIKERGGLTIAQDPDEAQHDGMPRSAIATGMVDWVLPTGAIPERLLRYFARRVLLKLPSEEGAQPARAIMPLTDGSELTLREVLAHLRAVTGHDFTYYKRGTIVRRIARRMQVNDTQDVAAYLTFLRTHPGEAGALLQDLLISVTNFFRDREAFETLEHHLPALFKDKGHADALRVWVPACATGEEAYSIAILLQEQASRYDQPPLLQVFACDLDEEAISRARSGLYPAAIAADVSEERCGVSL